MIHVAHPGAFVIGVLSSVEGEPSAITKTPIAFWRENEDGSISPLAFDGSEISKGWFFGGTIWYLQDGFCYNEDGSYVSLAADFPRL